MLAVGRALMLNPDCMLFVFHGAPAQLRKDEEVKARYLGI